MSEKAIEILDKEELEALLAHEFAHHVLGHCRWHISMHWMGRFTFMGGAFINALVNSSGSELAADRYAVARLGVRRETLWRCLVKMRAVSALDVLQTLGRGKGMALVGEYGSEEGEQETVQNVLWRAWWSMMRALKLWYLIYTSDSAVAYWHPSLAERIAAVQESRSHDGPA